MAFLLVVCAACSAQPETLQDPTSEEPPTPTAIETTAPATDTLPEVEPIPKPDSSFYFSIKTNGSGYNSKTGKFWRMYSGGEIRYYNITLTTEEMEAVYNAIEDADFNSFPNKFEPQTDTINEVEPNFYYIISSNIGGENHKVYYSDASTDRAMRKAGKPFLALYSTIYRIVESNAEVKKVPESNIGWE